MSLNQYPQFWKLRYTTANMLCCVSICKLFATGRQVPSLGDGTEVIIPLTLDAGAKPDGTSWSAQILDSTKTTLILKVRLYLAFASL